MFYYPETHAPCRCPIRPNRRVANLNRGLDNAAAGGVYVFEWFQAQPSKSRNAPKSTSGMK